MDGILWILGTDTRYGYSVLVHLTVNDYNVILIWILQAIMIILYMIRNRKTWRLPLASPPVELIHSNR